LATEPAGPFPLQIPGPDRHLRLRVHSATDLHISRQIREQGIWEPYESSLVQQYLQPGDVFLDAGANIGYFTVLAAACVGERGHVYAFEPEPRNFRLLQDNVELNGFSSAVSCMQVALTAESGVGQLYLHPENLGDHQLFSNGEDRQSVAVELLAGVDVFSNGDVRLDLVKIDTQGAEQAVVQGLLPLLRESGATLKMLIELTPFSLRQAGTTGSDFVALLATLDLPFCIVDHIEHQLVSVSVAELQRWCANVDECAEDKGFMNIFLGAQV
jgi:FkbM family methyltransferase